MNDDHSPQQRISIEPPRPIVIAATVTLGILALFLLALCIDTLQNLGESPTAQQNTITVQGMGKATAVPDIANISYTVMESASTVAAAQSSATDKSNAALAAMKAEGIADADIQTTSYNVMPQYASNPCPLGAMCPQNNNTITGYQVSQTVSLKVRDTSKVGDVLQKLGSLGVQNVNGPDFTVDNDTAVNDQARAAAIADAKQKAETLAKQLGVHLGKLESFSQDNGGPRPMYAAMSAGAATDKAVAPNIPTGQNETDVTVTLTYEIN